MPFSTLVTAGTAAQAEIAVSFWRTLKSVGDIFGVTQKLNKARTIAENANKDVGGDPRYDGGYKASNTGETAADAVGRAIADGEGDGE